ncbi:MAG: hypothetical protein KDA79_13365 [Planctomycetaceae bacterium]|nr:hypothetical protein [Planctomycetaceae bacterium]
MPPTARLRLSPQPAFRSQARLRFSALTILLLATLLPGSSLLSAQAAGAAELKAGAAKVDITSPDAGPVDGRLHVRALVLQSGDVTATLITLDVVAIGEIGYVTNEYLPELRARLESELGIPPESVLVNASHCHGIPCTDVGERTFQAVKQARENMVPVQVGAGSGHEDRIQENRRLKLKSGREADVRHAYALPPDEEVVGSGPIDPEIGILKLNRLDGTPVAVVYNFACHPIQGVPGAKNTADMTGFSSEVIEDNLGDGAVALFVQGCGGDINPARYKQVDAPRHAEPLGNILALSTLKGIREIECTADSRLKIINHTLELPRADLASRIAAMETERERMLRTLRGTSLNLKTFLPLMVKYSVNGDFPSYYSHAYLSEDELGRDHLRALDAENRRNLQQYIANIHTMEELTRLQTNLALLNKHEARAVAAGKRSIDVEVCALRVGDFVLATFPGELVAQIGLNIKKASPHPKTFVAGYTNGYIYYSPTAEQLLNVGGAQEDSDCLLAPEWQAKFEGKVAELLKGL